MFKMTEEGYKKAKSYLDKIGKYNEFENNNTSNDGYSLVLYANRILEKEEKND